MLWHLALMSVPLAAWIYATIVTHGFPLTGVFEGVLIVLLALLLPYSVRPGELYELPVWIVATIWIALAAVSVAVIYVLPPVVAVEALLLAVVLAGRWIWVRIPDALEMEPRKAGKSKAVSLAPTTDRLTRRWILRMWRPLVFSYAERGSDALFFLMFYVLAFLFGTAGAGHVQLYVLFCATLPLSYAQRGTAWLAAFPLSNRARLSCILVPGLLLGLGSYGLGRMVSPIFHVARDPMSIGAPELAGDSTGTRLPLEFWRMQSTASDVVITAPWGEKTIADRYSVGRLELYNPYSTRRENSARFTEWQFGRATTAVFGRPMKREAYNRSASVGTFPSALVAAPRMKILDGAAVLMGALVFALLAELSSSNRLDRRRWHAWFYGILMLLSLFALIGVDMMYATRGVWDVIAPIAEKVLLHVSGVLPSSLAVVIVIAAIPLLAIYALLEWQFGKSEPTRALVRESKIGRALTRPISFFHTA